ncbi:hypothetical protein CVT26_009426 [Gymnopilus dilepis]|uniref:Protein YIF1 n=1 Tax=Gymnopilus dilepis TaxID=231916 RepID=A0A409WUM8_9AGAR|nr:hypothetical protein CVT26_009426 [Gymnopilus dilepis]
MSQFNSHSPPPLRHPVPTHPAYIPEPPLTPGSPQGYQRFSSSPAPGGSSGLPPNPPSQFAGPQTHVQGGLPHLGGQQGGPGQGQIPAYPMSVPAYTSPFQHSQPGQGPGQYAAGPMGSMHAPHQQHGHGHGHPQQHGGHPGHPQQPAAADFSAWGFDGATAQLGMQLGSSAVAAGQDYVQRNVRVSFLCLLPLSSSLPVSSSSPPLLSKPSLLLAIANYPPLPPTQFGTFLPSSHIKHQFNVSNSYVMRKLRLLLFPWTHKTYFRRPRAQGEWLPPREDINSPDLYIPVMSIFTYILLTTLHAGIKERFSPLVLGESASRALTALITDFALVKLGCYILNIPASSPVSDLLAYGGYKFVG